MPLPEIIDTARDHLFADVQDMQRIGLPLATQEHLFRLRDLYNFWLQHPRFKDKEIVLKLQQDYKLGKSQAYTDLSILKLLLGEFQKTSKDYHRYRFLEMIHEAYEVARINKDAKAMTAAADKYAKYTQLDKDDELNFDYDKIVVQAFVPTDDPSVSGFKPIPNLRDVVRKKIEQYSKEYDYVEEIKPEDEDYNPDDIFKVNPNAENLP
ncbi:MAG: hypothetical protein IKC70_04305 [Bacteroidaceae bacterium]|nr:hypothetical protein [Bacteroidaceae bacterium]